MKTRVLPPLLFAMGLPFCVHAAGISADLGTTGVGVHFVMPVQPNVNARFGANYLQFSHEISTANVDYDAKPRLRTLDVLLDYFPTANRFRLTAGLIYNGNKIDATGRPNAGTYTINGVTYDASSAGTLEGRIDFRTIAPYLGIGWGNAAAREKGWGFSADLGVMFQGSPSTSLSSVGCTASPAVCASLAGNLETERRALEDKIDDYKYFPVARIGVSYRF